MPSFRSFGSDFFGTYQIPTDRHKSTQNHVAIFDGGINVLIVKVWIRVQGGLECRCGARWNATGIQREQIREYLGALAPVDTTGSLVSARK